jgi:hypothetical protein
MVCGCMSEGAACSCVFVWRLPRLRGTGTQMPCEMDRWEQGSSAPYAFLSAPGAIFVQASVHAVEEPWLPLQNLSAHAPGAAELQCALKGGGPLDGRTCLQERPTSFPGCSVSEAALAQPRGGDSQGLKAQVRAELHRPVLVAASGEMCILACRVCHSGWTWREESVKTVTGSVYLVYS